MFDPLKTAGWPLQRISDHLRESKVDGARLATLSRISSGERLPSTKVLHALLDLVGQVAGRPVPGEARQQLLALRLQELAVVDPKSYEIEILRQTTVQLDRRCEGQIDRHSDGAMPAEADDGGAEATDDGESRLPYPVLALRADTVAHVEDVAAAGVPLPAGLMEPEPDSRSTVMGVLYEIHDVLGHISRALDRALAEADTEPDDVPPPAPSPMPSAPYALDPLDPTPAERDGCVVPAMTVVLVVALLVLGSVYMVPFVKKQWEAAEARESPSATVTATATATSTGGSGGTGGGSGGAPGPTPTPEITKDRDPSPRQSTKKPPTETQSSDPTITITDPPEEERPVLGGRGMNAEPRLDSADCSQPVVFTFFAAAQRPGTIDFAWHADEQLIARGVQDRTGTMTFTTTNEQQDQFSVQLTGTQPGERVQGSMTVEVTSPEADQGTTSAYIDITCI
ncbi:hypothetical protein [Streptomyces sp. NPDC005017]|uniref:hypothetical protein n=1 Tax=Streptomyces sp. NPDC005017 TaxID=3364706 RepID=UPI0036AB2271